MDLRSCLNFMILQSLLVKREQVIGFQYQRIYFLTAWKRVCKLQLLQLLQLYEVSDFVLVMFSRDCVPEISRWRIALYEWRYESPENIGDAKQETWHSGEKLETLLQKFSCIAFLYLLQIFRYAGKNNVTTFVACFRPQVNYPVGIFYYICIVLNYPNGMPLVY